MKQVILARKHLRLSKGKLSSQVAHASTEAALKSSKSKIEEWRKAGMKKVVLKVKNEKDLIKYKRKADKAKLITALIRDAGRTEVEPGTITTLAIGPDEEKKINKITGKLKML